MSSSRRSSTSRSTRSFRRPTWLSPAPRDSPSAHVSLVLAEPEQRPPQSSAASKLSSTPSAPKMKDSTTDDLTLDKNTTYPPAQPHVVEPDPARSILNPPLLPATNTPPNVGTDSDCISTYTDADGGTTVVPVVFPPLSNSEKSTPPSSDTQLPQASSVTLSWLGSFSRSQSTPSGPPSAPDPQPVPPISLLSNGPSVISPLQSHNIDLENNGDLSGPQRDIDPELIQTVREHVPAQRITAPSKEQTLPLLQTDNPSVQKTSWFLFSNPNPAHAGGPTNTSPLSHNQKIESPSEVTSPQDSLPSSLDDSVPPIFNYPVDNTELHVQKLLPNTDNTKLGSLNPSTSRFTLSIPLLGRAKLPLESVIGVNSPEKGSREIKREAAIPQIENTNINAHSLAPVDTHSLSSPHIQEDFVQSPALPMPPNSPPSSSPVNPPTSTEETNLLVSTNSSTWWNYVPWSSAPSAPPAPLNSDKDVLPSSPFADSNFSQDTPLTPPISHIENKNPRISDPTPLPGKYDNDTSPESEQTISSNNDTGETIQELSAVQANSQSWYNPWAWYSSTHTNPVEIFDSARQDPDPNEVQREIGTEERNTPVGKTSKKDDIPTLPIQSNTPEVANPIVETIETQRSAWVSFFSSRSMLVKAIGYGSSGADSDVKCDENGNEIMEVEFNSENNEGFPEKENSRDIAPQPSGKQGQNKEREGVITRVKDEPLSFSSKAGATNANDVKPSQDDLTHDKQSGKFYVVPLLTIADAVKREIMASETSEKATSKSGSESNTPISSSLPQSNPSTAAQIVGNKRKASPAPSKKSVSKPNLVLPTWEDTFHTVPRNVLPPQITGTSDDDGVGKNLIGKTVKYVSSVLFAKNADGNKKGKGRERSASLSGTTKEEQDRARFLKFGQELPRAWKVLEGTEKGSHTNETTKLTPEQGRVVGDVLKGCTKVVVIGIHGWFPGAVMRSVLGEPTGTSAKFVNMMVTALEDFQVEYNVKLKKITGIPLEGEGTITHRVERLYTNLLSKNEWMEDLHEADAIFIATHSQGSIVSTHLLQRLIQDKHIRASGNSPIDGSASFPATYGVNFLTAPMPQKVCCLALCGIHLGPLRYLSTSSLVQPYLQYFESAAARELFDFQNTESEVSKAYIEALRFVVDHGTKMVYIASLNDQVVPIYSGLFTAASHPLILRALYIDGDAYHSSDFLSNLLVLLLRILNSGIPDSGLIAHLSEATAGSLNGIGHSTAYEELATYSLAVKYLFLANDGLAKHSDLVVEPFNARSEQNDYEIPWSLRDIIADERVSHFFSREIHELRDAFHEWQPKTTILRDLKRKLQPIQRLPLSFSSQHSSTNL